MCDTPQQYTSYKFSVLCTQYTHLDVMKMWPAFCYICLLCLLILLAACLNLQSTSAHGVCRWWHSNPTVRWIRNNIRAENAYFDFEYGACGPPNGKHTSILQINCFGLYCKMFMTTSYLGNGQTAIGCRDTNQLIMVKYMLFFFLLCFSFSICSCILCFDFAQELVIGDYCFQWYF